MFKLFHKLPVSWIGPAYVRMALFSALIPAFHVYALDEERLWLPSSHERLYLSLKKAAMEAEALERCVIVLRGTIDFDQSEPNHPIFRIQCRQENGRTYNEMVDGLSFDTLTTEVVEKKSLSPEELEAIRIEEERKRIEAIKYDFFCACRDEFQEKTKSFMGLAVLNPEPVPTVFSPEAAVYIFHFDAESLEKEALHYEAICSIEAGSPARIRIKKRRSAKKPR